MPISLDDVQWLKPGNPPVFSRRRHQEVPARPNWLEIQQQLALPVPARQENPPC
jgi:hypothetical protein